MRQSRIIGVAVCVAFVLASVAAAQVQRRPVADDKVGVNIGLQVGGGAYQFAGPASCTSMPKAAQFGVVGQKWQVVQSDGSRSVILNVIRPASGAGDMFSLSVESGGKSYDVNTLKAKESDPVTGSGSVTLAAAGNGATFTIAATAANGAKIAGTIKCDGFRTPYAVGGH